MSPIRAAIFGHFVGDLFAIPCEFASPDPTRRVELRGFGTTVSRRALGATTARTLALLDSLLSAGFDPGTRAARMGR